MHNIPVSTILAFLLITAAPAAADDMYEENDTMLEASWIPFEFGGTVVLSDLAGPGIQADDDWYWFEVENDGVDVVIELEFTHAEGDVDMELVDETETVLDFSDGTDDFELIVYHLPTAGVYFVHVYYGNQGNSYDLRISDESGVFADGFESGDTSRWF